MTTLDPTPAVPDHLPTVMVTDTEAAFTGFVVADRDTVTLLGAATDPERTAREALTLGCRALLGAAARADGLTLTAAVDQARRLLDETASMTDARYAELTAALFGDGGALPRTVTDLRDAVRAVVAEAFDPDRRESALSRLIEVFADFDSTQRGVLRTVLDPDDGEGPLGRLMRSMREQHQEHMDAIARLAADEATRRGEATMFEKTAIKGGPFEEMVHDAVAGAASIWGDIPDAVGRKRGTTGGMTGDTVVEIPGVGCYVIEAKNTHLSLKRALAELRKAVGNHEATSGVIVFSSAANSPAPGPFTTYGDLAVAVLSEDDPDPLVIRVACAWARAQVIGTVEPAAIDTVTLRTRVDDIRRALQRVTDAKKALGGAARQIQHAGNHVDELREDVERALDQLLRELDN